MMSEEDGLDGVLGKIQMGKWQVLFILINSLVWSVLAPHTIGTTLLNAPVSFKCSDTSQSAVFASTSRHSKQLKDPVNIRLLEDEDNKVTTTSPYTITISSNLEEESKYVTEPNIIHSVTSDTTKEKNGTIKLEESTEPAEKETVENKETSRIMKRELSRDNSALNNNEDRTPTNKNRILDDDGTPRREKIIVKEDGVSTNQNACFNKAHSNVMPGVYDVWNESYVVGDTLYLQEQHRRDEDLLREGSVIGHRMDLAAPSCPSVKYDTSIFTSTITTEWNLICENSLLRPFFQNAYTLGTMAGCLIGGDIGDRFGRVAAIRAGAIMHVLPSLVVAFTTNFTALCIARFFVGLTNLGILIPAVTLALETCPAKLRGTVGMGIGLPYSFGVIIFGCVGYFFRSWRHLYMITSFPAFLMLPVSFLLDESPRWLLQNGRLLEAKNVLLKAAQVNKSSLPNDSALDKILIQVAQQEIQDSSPEAKQELRIIDKIKIGARKMASFYMTPAMRLISIVAPINWSCNDAIYYGIIFNANNFSQGNPFLYIALTGVSDAAAIFFGAPLAAKMGNRNTVGLTQILAGLMIATVLVVPNELRWLQWILVMGSFLMSAAAAQILFVYTPELFPTTLRSRGLALCNFTGYGGEFAALYVSEVLPMLFGSWVTNCTLGGCGILGGLSIFLLPETRNMVLCETVEDVEDRAKLMKKQTLTSFEDGQMKLNNADIEKGIVLSNTLKSAPNSRLNNSTAKSQIIGSINSSLESSESLSTLSFDTYNTSSFVAIREENSHNSDDSVGNDNQAYENEPQIMQISKIESRKKSMANYKI